MVHGAGWAKAAVLFAIAAGAAIVAVRLPVRHDLLRGVFKAGSLLLLLAALPAGLKVSNLAPSTLFLSMLFAVFAHALRDAFLRAAGTLMLLATIALFHREGVAAPLLFAASAVGAALHLARAEGPSPRSLGLLLGALAHGLFLYGLARVVPPAWLGHAWLAAAVVLQASARFRPLALLEAGAALASAAAAVRAFATPPVDPVSLAAVAGALLVQAGLSPDAPAW